MDRILPISPKILRLLSYLRQDSRQKLTEISKQTKIPISTLFDLLKESQEEKLIWKSTVLLNFSKLGYHTQAQVFLKVHREGREAFQKHLLYHESINTIYRINNGWDFIVETVHRNIKELNTFLEKLEEYGLEDKEIHYLVEEVKREGFMEVF